MNSDRKHEKWIAELKNNNTRKVKDDFIFRV